ncbi:MAG: energy transducer TonB [Cypionkella sp.]
MYVSQPPRAVSAALSTGLTAAVVALLAFGFGVGREAQAVPGLLAVELRDPPPPPPPPPERPERRRADRPAPANDPGRRNLENKATAIVAPPVTPLIVPPPVVAAPAADTGSAAQTGASPLPGPGRGAGSYGDGIGGGGTGGDGDGTGDGLMARPPRQIGGRISYRDLPEDTLALGEEAAVTVTYTIERDGRASGCRVERPSGYPTIDHLTCRLIEQRFRFRPAVDRRGEAIRMPTRQNHYWYAREE